MPTRPLSIAAILLALPVALLAFFAVRSLSLENEALNVRHERLAKQRLDTAATVVSSRLQNLGADVLARAQAAYAAGEADALSKLTRRRQFTFAFVFKHGAQLYTASSLEHQYDSARALQDKAQALAATLTAPDASTVALVATGGGHGLLRCARNALEYDICVAIDGNDVRQALQSALEQSAHSTGLVRAGLIGPDGFAIKTQTTEEPGSGSHTFNGLLRGWQLRGEEPLSREFGFRQIQSLYLVAGALILGWLAMAWMLYRSSVLKDEAASARANVVAQLAHELRTPLTNLKLHTELLLRKSSDEPAVKRYGAVLENEIERLSNLAENAISVARGAMAQAKFETAVPDDSVRAILERFEPTLADARCETLFKAGAAMPTVFDRASWERCIINLIDNARKYAPGSKIEVSTGQNLDMLRLEVKDRGPGIAPGHEQLIFEPLERGMATKASGFGLGLAAVRTMTRQNGGDCWVEALHPGTLFVLTMKALPVATVEQEKMTP